MVVEVVSLVRDDREVGLLVVAAADAPHGLDGVNAHRHRVVDAHDVPDLFGAVAVVRISVRLAEVVGDNFEGDRLGGGRRRRLHPVVGRAAGEQQKGREEDRAHRHAGDFTPGCTPRLTDPYALLAEEAAAYAC